MKRIFVAGATGFIGSLLVKELAKQGYEVHALVRGLKKARNLPPGVHPVFGDAMLPGTWQEEASLCQVGINLVGVSIFRRWTKPYREIILASRLTSTRLLGEALSQGKGRVLINASAVGFYGDRGEEEVLEGHPPGSDFLARVCQRWEEEAFKFKDRLRVVTLRQGVVLGKGGGALSKMLLAFRLGLGGPMGSGKQWFSWIHIADEIRAIIFLMEREHLNGPFNLVAPYPIRQREFARILGKVLHRPAFLPLPSWALKLAFGEAGTILLQSCRAKPMRLLEAGFSFLYPDARAALESLV